MAILRIMIGLPASGKSTYCAECKSMGNWVVNSSDAIREELYGSADDQSHNNEIFNTMYRRTIAALVSDINCIYDATNLTSKRRANLIKEIRRNCPSVKIEAIVMATPYHICLKRNFSRERTVPANVILSMMKRFEMPAKWEGFDEIKVYGNDKPEYLNEMESLDKIANSMEQDNPHHSLTVGHHMQKALSLYIKSEDEIDYVVSKAISYHDIGKVYCKSFINSRGELTDIAHFYNHQNVGAFLYLSLLGIADINGKLRPQDLEIVYLIQHHMSFFNDEKYLKKIKERFGLDFYSKLETVHKFDIASH